jgi:hypothetical protein
MAQDTVPVVPASLGRFRLARQATGAVPSALREMLAALDRAPALEQVITRLSLEPGISNLHWHLEEEEEFPGWDTRYWPDRRECPSKPTNTAGREE